MSLEILGCWTGFPKIVLSRCCGTCPPPSHSSSQGPLLTDLPVPSVYHWLFFAFPALMTPAFPNPSQGVSIPFLSLTLPSQAPQDAGAHRTGRNTASAGGSTRAGHAPWSRGAHGGQLSRDTGRGQAMPRQDLLVDGMLVFGN